MLLTARVHSSVRAAENPIDALYFLMSEVLTVRNEKVCSPRAKCALNQDSVSTLTLETNRAFAKETNVVHGTLVLLRILAWVLRIP